MESGAFYPLGSHLPGDHSHSLGPTPGNITVAQQKDKFTALMKTGNCSDIDCLLDLDEGKLFSVQYRALHTEQGNPLAGMWPWEPTIDGVDLLEAGPVLAERGEIAPVPVLVGSNMEDVSIIPFTWKCDPDTCSEEDFWRLLVNAWGFNQTDANRLLKLYSNEGSRHFSNATKWYWAAWHAGTDASMTCSSRRMAGWAAQAGQRAFWYYWTYAPVKLDGHPKLPPGGACHGCEIAFVFHASDFMHPSEVEFSSQVVAYWSSFVASGSPGASGLPVWPQFTHRRKHALVFNDNMTAVAADAFLEEKCNFWDMHFNEQWGLRSKGTDRGEPTERTNAGGRARKPSSLMGLSAPIVSSGLNIWTMLVEWCMSAWGLRSITAPTIIV